MKGGLRTKTTLQHYNTTAAQSAHYLLYIIGKNHNPYPTMYFKHPFILESLARL